MDDVSTGSESDYSNSWISWFLATKGNEYFCEVEEDYILDRFNLTGLASECQNYQQALDLITDRVDDLDDDIRTTVEIQARLLYGLIHARWIITSRGLAKMMEKYKKADFGRCPRVLCFSHPLLPIGLSDMPYEKAVKLYCPRCEDLYSPKSSRHGSIDGAYFGTTFPHILFMVYPQLIPMKAPDIPPGARERESGRPEKAGPSTVAPGTSTAAVALKAEIYRPTIFGFQVNEIAKLQRWQGAMRDKLVLVYSWSSLFRMTDGLVSNFTDPPCLLWAFCSGKYRDWRSWKCTMREQRSKLDMTLIPPILGSLATYLYNLCIVSDCLVPRYLPLMHDVRLHTRNECLAANPLGREAPVSVPHAINTLYEHRSSIPRGLLPCLSPLTSLLLPQMRYQRHQMPWRQPRP
ncbi:hypothetical protein DL93DRAFT_57709 [Clavulina sp. PMI_390]|nr:hypothetical protein DL93DRAFT_57709 [Clavulina sp. PMI_390]